jgi:hypothetical protein
MKRSILKDLLDYDPNRETFTWSDGILYGIIVPIAFVIAGGFFPWLFAQLCQYE